MPPLGRNAERSAGASILGPSVDRDPFACADLEGATRNPRLRRTQYGEASARAFAPRRILHVLHAADALDDVRDRVDVKQERVVATLGHHDDVASRKRRAVGW